MTDRLKPDVEELKPYLDAGWQLIPLHRYDYTDQYHGRARDRGKSPLDNNWTTKPYKSKDQLKHAAEGFNVGVRLRPFDLVIDVDPRNFPEGETLGTDNPFARFCKDVGLDPEACPTVETGSGGLHLYLTKPDNILVRDSLEDYTGVEFKTKGRQVVAAGSIHPTAKKLYLWDFLRPSLNEVPRASDRLLNVIKRPSGRAATGGGEYSQEEVAEMLDALDPIDFRNHDDWLRLMQATHHASGGDARAEFVEWSTRDPEYSDRGSEIGRRWDSLHSDSKGARITYRTLHKLLRDADQAEAIPRTPAEDDFEAIDPIDDLDLGPDDGTGERLGPLEKLNKSYIAVMDNGKYRIYYESMDPTYEPPRTYWSKAAPQDFKGYLANRKIQKGNGIVDLADAWLEWPGRRSAKGIIFDPEREHDGFLNLWTGWGVVPRKGDWSMLDELLFEVLCDGDEAVYEYVLNWAAYMVQHPGRPAEVAICFQGEKGTGKGTWGRTLAALAGGKHGLQVNSPDQLTGRFNSHLRDKILLFADEAINPYDKKAESMLKGLITEPILAFEGKGKDIETGKNVIHVVMATNEDFFVPMGLDGERRFLLQRVNTKRQGDLNWFNKLYRQLNKGGYAALLWDLLNRDIGDWTPRGDIPTTTAAMEQKIRNMHPVPAWWFGILREGELPFETTRGEEWWMGAVRALKDDVRGAFIEHARRFDQKAGASGRSQEMLFAQELKRLIPGLKDRVREKVPSDRLDIQAHSDGMAWAYEIPSLSECRAHMDKLLGLDVDWS